MDNIKYEIKVTKRWTEEVTQTNWKLVADTGGEDGGAKYAYVKCEATMHKDEDIFSQILEEIDLTHIIVTINKKKED